MPEKLNWQSMEKWSAGPYVLQSILTLDMIVTGSGSWQNLELIKDMS